MLAKYFLIIRNYVLSVFFAKKVHYLPPKQAFRTNSHHMIGRNHSTVILLLANQDLTSMVLLAICSKTDLVRRITFDLYSKSIKNDPDYKQLALLGRVYTATDHIFIRTKNGS